MCTVVEICSTGVRVTLSDVPEVLLTATNSEPPVQDAGLAAKAGTLFKPHRTSVRCRFSLGLDFSCCIKPLTFNSIHALLANEVRTGRSKHRPSRPGTAPYVAVDRRAQLSGAQLHARHDAGRRRCALLSLELPGARHCGARGGIVHRISGPHSTR